GSAVEKMMAHQTKEPMDVRELAPDVPEGLVAVVKKLMSKKPDDRFNGCDELVEALERYLGDLSKMPGGVPASAMMSGSARGGSSGQMPGLRGGSSGQMPGLRGGSVGRMAGLPAQPPGSVPGAKVPPPPSHAGARASSLGLGGAGSHPGVKP